MTTPGSRADPPGPGSARPAEDPARDSATPAGSLPGSLTEPTQPDTGTALAPAGPADVAAPAAPTDVSGPAGPAGPATPTDSTAPAGGMRRAARVAAEVFTRFAELALIFIGLFGLFGDWRIEDVELLMIFDLVAMAYLAIGFVVIRRQRKPTSTGHAVNAHRLRFDLLFAVTAALIGLYSALTVAASDPDPESAQILTLVGVLTVVLSWMLLHAGHARHYRNIYARLGGGLEWPVATPDPAHPPSARPLPQQLDFVYFAYAIGTSFGATDVLVTRRGMRWAVLLHSSLAFFFNAAVLAFLISRLSSM